MGTLQLRNALNVKQALWIQAGAGFVVTMVTIALQMNVFRWPSFCISLLFIFVNIFVIMWATAKCRSFYEDKMRKKEVIETIKITAVQILATALMGILIFYCTALYEGIPENYKNYILFL